jgi:hypothetical protein
MIAPPKDLTPEQRERIGKAAFKFGKYLGFFIVAMGAAATLEAFWSGDWRWFVLAVPAYIIIRKVIADQQGG